MNPDGQAAQRRTNANLVDLNRNFPYHWAPLGVPGDSEYGGTGPASEPETQAIVDLDLGDPARARASGTTRTCSASPRPRAATVSSRRATPS